MSNAFNSKHGEISTPVTLVNLTLTQLRDVYNELTGKSIKGFNSKGKGVETTAKALANWQAATNGRGDRAKAIAESAARVKAKKPAAKVAAPKGERKPGGRAWKDQPAKAEQKPARRGSKVEKVLVLLGQAGGTTREEMAKEAGVTVHALMGILRWLSRGMGFGVHRMESGNFRIVNRDGHAIGYKPTPADKE